MAKKLPDRRGKAGEEIAIATQDLLSTISGWQKYIGSQRDLVRPNNSKSNNNPKQTVTNMHIQTSVLT